MVRLCTVMNYIRIESEGFEYPSDPLLVRSCCCRQFWEYPCIRLTSVFPEMVQEKFGILGIHFEFLK
jgi:hypothetical protein